MKGKFEPLQPLQNKHLLYFISYYFSFVNMSSTNTVSTQTQARKERRPLTEEQRDVLRARLVKARAVKKERAAARERAAAFFPPPSMVEYLPNPLAPKKPTYWDADTADLHPSVRMLFAALGPIQRSGEGCDCGEC